MLVVRSLCEMLGYMAMDSELNCWTFDDLKDRVEALENSNQDLQQRVAELEESSRTTQPADDNEAAHEHDGIEEYYRWLQR